MRHDPDLLAACERGDEDAWRTLIETYGRLVYSIPRRYRLAAADADDVFQAVFAGLHRGLGRIRAPERLSAWLITAAHRESLRARRRLQGGSAPGDPSADEELPAERMLAWERQHELHRGLAEVGSPCRELLEMLFLQADPPSYEEVAEMLGMKVGSIGPTRARCFEKLRRILAGCGLFEEG